MPRCQTLPPPGRGSRTQHHHNDRRSDLDLHGPDFDHQRSKVQHDRSDLDHHRPLSLTSSTASRDAEAPRNTRDPAPAKGGRRRRIPRCEHLGVQGWPAGEGAELRPQRCSPTGPGGECRGAERALRAPETAAGYAQARPRTGPKLGLGAPRPQSLVSGCRSWRLQGGNSGRSRRVTARSVHLRRGAAVAWRTHPGRAGRNRQPQPATRGGRR
jgi:hypothetical protein